MVRTHALILFGAIATVGCADLAPPRILHPGSEDYQQSRAERFDPYPLTDVAPEIVGGRPLQYIKPAPENERVQNELSFEERYRQVPPPGLYRLPRTPANRQGVIYSAPGVQPMGVAPPGAAAPVVQLNPGTTPPFTP